MSEEPKTIRDLLIKAEKDGEFGHGYNNTIYEIPESQYLIRVYNNKSWAFGDFTDFLNTSTSLTPVFLCPQNVGQPLLNSSAGFEITKKVDGKTLRHIENALLKEEYQKSENPYVAEFKAKQSVLRLLCDLPDESFCNLLKHIQSLSLQGITIDFTSGNIILNEKTKALSVIDVGYGSRTYLYEGHKNTENIASLNDWDKAITRLLEVQYTIRDNGEQDKILAKDRALLEEKTKRCAKQVNGPKTGEEITAAAAQGKIIFKRLSTIPDPAIGATLSLNDTPKALFEKLKAIEAYSKAQTSPTR